MSARPAVLLVAIAATATAGALDPAPAGAASFPVVGVADQKPSTFSHPLFTADLGVRRTRIVVPWNVALRASDRARFEEWLTAARRARTEPLVAFNHSTGSRCPRRPCNAPSARSYKRAFLAFYRRYRRKGVRLISPWNEANHQTQPTGRRPRHAAAYYNVVRRYCRGCTIVAVDLLDSSNMRRYLRTFMRHADGRPRIIGLHNYSDTNRRRTTGTRRLISELRRDRRLRGARIWLTETGGIARFETSDGRVPFPMSESRQRSATIHMFRIASKYRRYIRRLYIYHWSPDPTGRNRFDAGLVRADGSPRPAYEIVRRYRRHVR